MTTSVVTPWLDHRELWPDYWSALLTEDPHEVIIVDNGSDPALDFRGTRLEVIRLEENVGYVGGCNTGLYVATGEAVLFLNNDIVALEPGWLKQITDALEPGVLVGANLRFDRHSDVDGRSYPYLDGWCLAGMRDDLLTLTGFDKSFTEPAYYSDNDLCFRARLEGMRLREIPATLGHKGSATAGREINDERRELLKKNYAIYAERVRAYEEAA